MSGEQTTIDTTDALAVECEKKARMFLEQALGPVVTDIGNAHGREGIVAFCAGIEINFAIEMRRALGTNITMEVLKQAITRVLEDHKIAEHESMMKAAGDVLSGKAH
jgi:hypothetical protein